MTDIDIAKLREWLKKEPAAMFVENRRIIDAMPEVLDALEAGLERERRANAALLEALSVALLGGAPSPRPRLSETREACDLAEQCADYLAHEIATNGDAGGRMQEFVDAIRAVVLACDSHEDASTPAFDEIATLCGCPQWDYPGQLVRDVAKVAKERDELRLELAERTAERDALLAKAAEGCLEHGELSDRIRDAIALAKMRAYCAANDIGLAELVELACERSSATPAPRSNEP